MKKRWIEVIKLAMASGEEVEREMMQLNLQAYPPDIEEDGDMDSEAIKNLEKELHIHEALVSKKTKGQKAGYI